MEASPWNLALMTCGGCSRCHKSLPGHRLCENKIQEDIILVDMFRIRPSQYLGNDGMMGSGKTWHRIVGSRFMAIDKPA